MAEYSRMAKGHFTSTGFAQPIVLPFQPDFVEIFNQTAIATPTNHGIPFAKWDVSLGQGFAECFLFNATPVLTTGQVTSNGFSTFSAGTSFQYGPVVSHATTDFAISKASPAVVTQTAHGLQTGDVIVFSNLQQTASTGMQQIAGIPFMVTRTGANTFTINWDTSGSNYTAFNTSTSTGNVGSYKKILFPNLYIPGENIISALTLSTTTTVSTTMQHNYQVGQEVAFRIPATWGTTQLNELPNTLIPGSPIYGYVTSVTDAQNFVVNINSTGYTAFVPNQTFAGSVGRTPAQVIAAGDVNTGGTVISAGSQLYPPPHWSFAALNDSNTINGPAIVGSFVNNTRQGFIIGAGATTNDASSSLVGATNDVIYWRAYLHDLAVN